MKNALTFLITLVSFCTLNAQNISSPVHPAHVFSWDGRPGTESFQVAMLKSAELNHFVPVWTGNGLDQMNINVVLATLDGVNLEPGDEIAVFDGNLCVGMGKLSVTIDFQHMLNIKASRDDGSGNGYTPGHPIVYRFWDQSAGKEIVIVSAFYYSSNPAWSASGNYVIDGTSFVELTGRTFVAQSIDLTSGWNIFSVYLTPDSLNMKTIFKPLIEDGSLVKVQDEKGNSLEDYGMFGGWTDNIGNIALTEGYKAKVTRDCRLQLEGVPATLPVDIPLTTGWNIMGYPSRTETDGMTLVQPLINRNTLVKVQDEKGNSIEDYGMFGGWTNNIGNFKPGEGYKVKVTADETLTLSGSIQVQIPTVTTAAPDSITYASVILGGEVTNDGGSAVTERGICYGTTQTPTFENTKVVMGTGTGIFSGKITGLTAGTTFYARSYAVNSEGTAYGEQVSFTTYSGNHTGTFTDSRDGKTYKWVQIGDQIWMSENLAWLPSVSPPSAGSYTDPYYYVWGYSGTEVLAAKATSNYSTYGVLYNWPVSLMACPAGWHLPNDAEWSILTTYLGGGTAAGGKMKEIGTTHWYSPNTGATNESGFSGLPGGFRSYDGYFSGIGNHGFWWSSTENSTTNAWYRGMESDYTWVSRNLNSTADGFSVRCVRDAVSSLSVTTSSPDSVTSNSVILGGEVIFDGGSAVTERGICYGATQSPTIEDHKMLMGSGLGEFSGKITGLTAGATYFARAYAINGEGTAYGQQVTFTTTPSGNPTGTFTDSRDGKTYKWVQIGDQTWMAENLAWLPAVSPPTAESQTEPYYYVYDYSGTDITTARATANFSTYGVLYNWPAALTACPAGWHLPGDAEWKQLEIALGMTQAQADATGWRGTDQGTQMKSISGWYLNGNGTNSSGFSALPGGYRNYIGSFDSSGNLGHWWSSTEESATWALGRTLGYYGTSVYRGGSYEDYGYSVRCVRDHTSTPSVTTAPPDSITNASVILGGEVTSDGGSAVTERGICYGTTQTPTIENTKVVMGTGTGIFSGKITGLTAGTTWYARAYAINGEGTAYGQQVTFTTSASGNPIGTFTDSRDGKSYKWVQIGDQVWMAENLAWLPAVSPPTAESLSEPYYYVYDYSGTDVSAAKATSNYSTYGVFYNWPAALTACPAGWHLPGDAEWKKLEMALGMTQEQADLTEWRGTDQGTQMKTTSGWYNNGNGTNSSGFSALPGGHRDYDDSFNSVGSDGFWWSSTGTESPISWYRSLTYNIEYINRNVRWVYEGLCVRCLRD